MPVNFTSSELRLATATLAVVTAILPALYFLYPEKKQQESQHVKTFHQYVSSYSTLRPQALTATCSREFTHTVLPASLQLPVRGFEPFKQHAAMIFSLFESFNMVPQSEGRGDAVHFCSRTNTVIAHCKMGGKVSGESEKGKVLVEQGLSEWWTECVLFVRLSVDGRRVVEVREFVHSAKAEELQKRLTGVLS